MLQMLRPALRSFAAVTDVGWRCVGRKCFFMLNTKVKDLSLPFVLLFYI